jgi:hypothetical protein
VVVVVDGTVVVVSGGTVVGGTVVVVGAVVVVAGAVVAVTGGCVVVVADARVGGVVVDARVGGVVVVGNSADCGRVDTLDALAVGGVGVAAFFVVGLDFFEGAVVDVVLAVANGRVEVVVVVVLVTVVVGPNRAAVFSKAWPCTLIGRSSL